MTKNCEAALSKQSPNKVIVVTNNIITKLNQAIFAPQDFPLASENFRLATYLV